MKPLLRLSVFSLFGLTAVASLHAQEAGTFLKVPMSARAGGMGDTFAAVSDDPLGIYYNPAGIVFCRRQAVSLVYHQYLQDISGNSLAFVTPFKNWAVGFAPAVFSMKKEPIYDSLGNETGDSFGYKRTIIPIDFAYRRGNLGLGLVIKSYSEEIDGQASGTTAWDVGAIYRLRAWRFGFSAQNYGGKVYGYDVVKIQRLGIAYLPARQAGADGRYLVAADVKKEGEAGTSLSLGGEVALAAVLKLRGGWRFGEVFGGPTFGLGLEWGGINFDYAFLSYGDFGSTQKAGLSYAFGPDAGDRVKFKTFLNRVGDATGIAPEKTTRVRTGKLAAKTVYSAAVAEFTGKDAPKGSAARMTGYLRAALTATGRFQVMDKNTMATTLDEQKFQSSDCAKEKCALEMGGLLNVKMLFIGTLSKDAEGYNIKVDAVNIETGKTTAFYETKGLLDVELKDVCPRILEKMFQFK